MSDDDEIEQLLAGPRMRVHPLSEAEAITATATRFSDDGQLVADISEMITKGYARAGRDETGRIHYKITDEGRAWCGQQARAQRQLILMTGMEAGLL